jgi:hypothetical protein
MGTVAKRDLDHFIGRRHFKVQRQGRRGHDPLNVCIADMAAVFAQMGGNSVAAHLRDNLSGAHRVGMFAAACVPDGRDMIDVDAEA